MVDGTRLGVVVVMVIGFMSMIPMTTSRSKRVGVRDDDTKLLVVVRVVDRKDIIL